MLPRRPGYNLLSRVAWSTVVVVALELPSWSSPQLACRQCDSRGGDVGCVQCVVTRLVARTRYDYDWVGQLLNPPCKEDMISTMYVQGDFDEYGYRADANEHL